MILDFAPFSIYVDSRPLKVAFLADPQTNTLEQIDGVLEYCCEKWGGRYHPIALLARETLSDGYWALLEKIDPDIIAALCPLPEPVIEGLERRLSPFHVRYLDLTEGHQRLQINLPEDGLSILPTPENVMRSSWANSKVVHFTLSPDVDTAVRSFVHRSLGTFSDVYAVKRALEQNSITHATIRDSSSLAAALRSVSTFQPHAYPVQLCSVPNHFPDVQWRHVGDRFTVFVGDTIQDVVACWNHALLVPHYLRSTLMQVWIPETLLSDSVLQEALIRWLERLADPQGSTNKEMRFVSASVTEQRLSEMVNAVTQPLRVRASIEQLDFPEVPIFNESSVPKATSIYYRASAMSEQLVLSTPRVEPSWRGNEHWVADFYIEHRSPDFKNYIRDYWWQLPPRNSVIRDAFNRLSRVQASGFPSILVARGSPQVKVNVLPDPRVFSILARRHNAPVRPDDPRMRYSEPLFAKTQHSDKGRYLRGFIQVFGGLFPAFQVLENRYWRNTLARLALGTLSDDSRIEAIHNRLSKRLRPGSYMDSEALDWLAQYVLSEAKTVPRGGREIEYDTLLAEATQEFDAFVEMLGDRGHEFSFRKDDFDGSLAERTETGALLMGLKPKCPHCGYRIWYHVDDVTQQLRCRGCGAQFTVPPEQRWSYKLNSLIEAGTAQHGLIPIVLVLGQMLFHSRMSFLYDAGVELYEKGDRTCFGDIDVMAAVDGRLVIGEVKQTNQWFHPLDFQKMGEIARRLRPHALIFSSLEPTPTPAIERQVRALREELAPLRIDVSWYRLDGHMFDPTRVY